MKILYLYAELSPYLLPVFETLVKKYKAELHVVHWDHLKLTPFQPPVIEGVTYYKRTENKINHLKILTNKINPDLIFIAGWMDFDYLKIARKARIKGVPVVTVFDEIWLGTLRQIIGSFIVKTFRKLFFSHAFVSFARQYEYAKKFGFNDSNIVFNALSCNTNLFHHSKLTLNNKLNDYPKVFIYAGRFSQEKGIQILIDAFRIYRNKFNGNWKLICIGGGPLRNLFKDEDKIEVLDFISQEDLLLLFNKCGALIMPSLNDKSPLAVHEATAACLPLILSENIGNKSTFLIDGFNGFTFNSNSSDNLAATMRKMSSLSNSELINMSNNSFALSNRVTPEISAASLISIISN